MGKSKNADQRQRIIQVWRLEKLSYAALSRRFSLSYNTVRNICINFENQGDSSLVPNYSFCGRKISPESEKSYRLVRLVRHFHPSWGVPYILTRIQKTYPDLPLKGIRNYQKRLKKDGPKEEIPNPVVPKSQSMGKVRLAHDEWQIDAKERIKLPTGEETCFLNITDTKTNALLKVKPFSLWEN